MGKQSISRSELCANVLAELRRETDCAGVREIAITIEHVSGVGKTWHVTIVDNGDADPTILLTKARNLEEAWADRFEIAGS